MKPLLVRVYSHELEAHLRNLSLSLHVHTVTAHEWSFDQVDEILYVFMNIYETESIDVSR